jgi:CBS domain-containing protein
MSVEAIMHRDLVTVDPGQPVAAAVEKMVEHDLGAVLVMEGDSLVGVFSERDVLTRVVGEGRSAADTRVADVCSVEPVTVKASAPLRECWGLLEQKGFRHLPIVDDDGKAVGIISTRDLIRCMSIEVEPLSALERRFASIGALHMEFYD